MLRNVFYIRHSCRQRTRNKYGYLNKRGSKIKPVKLATLDCGEDSYALPSTEKLLEVDDYEGRESYFC